MDFRSRSAGSRPVANQPAVSPAASLHTASPALVSGSATPGNHRLSGPLRIASIVLLFAVTGLIVALAIVLGIGSASAERAVQKNLYQAVFLNNGQVYFGNIKSIGHKTVDLRNIYYLQTNASTTATNAQNTASNVSLIKLGCELHAPLDQMLINQDQVIYWENIKNDSQVVKAISDYKTKSPSQVCSQQSQSSTQQAPSSTSDTTTPATGTNATTKTP